MFPEEKIEKYLLLAFFFEPLLFTTFFSDFIVTLSLIIFVICLLKSIKNLLNTFMHSAFAEGLSRNILVLDHKQKNLQSNKEDKTNTLETSATWKLTLSNGEQ